MGASRWLLAQDRPDTIDPPVERGHDADARALRACHKVGISDIEAMHLVQLNSALEKRTINDAYGTKCKVGREFWCLQNFPDTPVVGFTESFAIYVNRSAPDMRIPGNR